MAGVDLKITHKMHEPSPSYLSSKVLASVHVDSSSLSSCLGRVNQCYLPLSWLIQVLDLQILSLSNYYYHANVDIPQDYSRPHYLEFTIFVLWVY